MWIVKGILLGILLFLVDGMSYMGIRVAMGITTSYSSYRNGYDRGRACG